MARIKNNALPQSKIVELVESKILKTNAMRHKHSTHTNMNAKTMRKLMKLSNIKFVRKQHMTGAHRRELNDIRNAVSLAVGMVCATEHKSDLDVVSFDASSFEVSRNGSIHEELVAIPNDQEEKDNHTSVSSSYGRNELPYSIKGMFATSRGGLVAPLVIIVADETLEKDEFHAHKAKGLSVTSSAEDTGYVVFSCTRSGSVLLWSWWIIEILLPFCLTIRENQIRSCEHSTFAFGDGEDCMMQALTSDPILQKFEEVGIDIGKIPASYSPTGAALDKSKALFQGTKKKIKGLSALDKSNDALKGILEEIVKKSGLTTRHRELAVAGIIKLQAAAGSQFTPGHIRHSYEHIGIRGILPDGTTGPKFETILDSAATEDSMSAEQRELIVNNFGKLKKFHEENGMLTDAFMVEECGITDFSCERPYDRDNRVLMHSRFVLVTSAAAKRRFHLGKEQISIVSENASMCSEDKRAHQLYVSERKERSLILKVLKVHFNALKKNKNENIAQKKRDEKVEVRTAKAVEKFERAANKMAPKTVAQRKRKSRIDSSAEEDCQCSNAMCMLPWSENLNDAENWLQCETCNAWFCFDLCGGMVDAHEKLCKLRHDTKSAKKPKRK